MLFSEVKKNILEASDKAKLLDSKRVNPEITVNPKLTKLATAVVSNINVVRTGSTNKSNAYLHPQIERIIKSSKNNDDDQKRLLDVFRLSKRTHQNYKRLIKGMKRRSPTSYSTNRVFAKYQERINNA